MLNLLNKDGEKILVRPAAVDEASLIADIYKHIAVTKDNYVSSLSHGEKSFENCGGMFEISNEEEIRQRINDKNEQLSVGLYKEKITSMLWYGLWQKGVFEDLTVLDGEESYYEIFRDAAERGKLGYSKEIISLWIAPEKTMSFALFYDMMKDYAERGIKYTVGEVYLINGYEDDAGYHESNLINKASYNFLVSTGGRHIGVTPQKKVCLKGFSVYKTPNIFIWDTEKSFKTIENILKKKGWGIEK